MKSIAELVAVLNASAYHFLQEAAKLQGSSEGAEAAKLQKACVDAREFAKTLREPKRRRDEDDLFSLNPLGLRDLPEELRADLKSYKDSAADAQILELMEIADRPVSIDEINVALYRKFGTVYKRNALASRLYRLAQQNLIHSAPGRKGFYVLGPAEEEQQ